VADGRRAEFGRHGWAAAEVPDPQDEATYSRSKLDWSQLDAEPHRDLLNWYRELITLRRRWPELTDPRLDRVDASCDVAARWLMISRGRLRVLANLGPSVARLPLGTSGAHLLAASTADLAVEGDAALLPPSSFAVVRV
jgi:maltooligosyltrehalose trehalohydrolase